MNYTPKSEEQNEQVVEIIVDDTDSETGKTVTNLPINQIEQACTSKPTVINTTDVTPYVFPKPLISSSTVSNTVQVPELQHAFTPNYIL